MRLDRTNLGDEPQKAQPELTQDYSKAACIYEAAIQAEPDVKSHYWNWGLMLLLQKKEEEALAIWGRGMVEGSPEELKEWTGEWVEILATEAKRQEMLQDYSLAWLIRGHIREIAPANINNLLQLIEIAFHQGHLPALDLNDWNLIEVVKGSAHASVDTDLLINALKNILKTCPLHSSTIELIKACVPHLQNHPDFGALILNSAIDVGYLRQRPTIAVSLLELCLTLKPEDPQILGHLVTFYQNGVDYAKGIETAKQYYSLMKSLPEKIWGNHLLLRGLMSAGGYWKEACSTLEEQESLLLKLTEAELKTLDASWAAHLISSAFFFPYFRDLPQQNRRLLNQVSGLCQEIIQRYATDQVTRYSEKFKRGKAIRGEVRIRPLKIGYLSSCLKSHSVGWLARWLFQYHDQDHFEVHTYLIGYGERGDSLENWYASGKYAHHLGKNHQEIAEQIFQDEIDILIDLDSITQDSTCSAVIALKPAPVQVTWLGWDTSGLPAIDYFITDPYVLPEDAQNYYTEKLWRLPQSYIGVDGFEVGTPTLRRDRLNIPSDAIVYFSGQSGLKRHPDTARLQMKILNQVPNSYFIVKGFADREAIKSLFINLAEEEGVESDRLRFLPIAPSEEIHRANLTIADVVLDTYPYNGATTSLETLWMGIPLVTRVGQQFASRNSYTMMMNVGVTQGIAWTDEEYVEWGIRLGKDLQLRQEISAKLRKSRQTSPLWNGQKFTREMEKAYEEMWKQYKTSSS